MDKSVVVFLTFFRAYCLRIKLTFFVGPRNAYKDLRKYSDSDMSEMSDGSAKAKLVIYSLFTSAVYDTQLEIFALILYVHTFIA